MKTAIKILALFLFIILNQSLFSQEKKKEDDVVPINIGEVEEVGEEEIFTMVEEMPSFPGGEDSLYKYLGMNIRYPLAAKSNGIQGIVYVTFVISKNGSVKDVKLLRGIGGGCDEEAIRVVQEMPNWNPGKQRGKNVNVQINMPIKFTVRKNKEQE